MSRLARAVAAVVVLVVPACSDGSDSEAARKSALRACKVFADIPDNETEAEGLERFARAIDLAKRAAEEDERWKPIYDGLTWVIRLSEVPADEARREADRYPSGEDPLSHAVSTCGETEDEPGNAAPEPSRDELRT